MGEFDPSRRVALYASVGPVLTRYVVDVAAASVSPAEAVTLPANIHYAWPHASGRFLYVASSDSAPGQGPAGNRHHVSAFRINPASGALTPHGDPIPLPTRPIHIAADIPSRYLLVAFSDPSALRVYRIDEDARLGDEVPQDAPIDPGIYPHQVRTTWDNRHVVLVTRGHNATSGKPEEPGALKVFSFADGQLSSEVSIAPDGGFGFGPRHLDFHPTEPLVYVSLERQNALATFQMVDGRISAFPLFKTTTLADPANVRPRQVAGTIHLHPNGRYVYVANRASGTTAFKGQEVFAGGENSIAVYAIDADSGEPRLVQRMETGGIHCRTFHIDPSGRMLVAAHIMALPVRSGSTVRIVPATLASFRIGEDGRLAPVQVHEVDVGQQTMFWMGMVPLS